MKRMTSEIIAVLQHCVDKNGDLPFEVRDSDNGFDYFEIDVFVDTPENGGCYEDESSVIGIAF